MLLQMLKSISSIIGLSVQDDKPAWVEWQRRQPPSHFHSSPIFDYYLTSHPQFIVSNQALSQISPSGKYISYCFGVFADLMFGIEVSMSLAAYCNIILDIYDSCKGYSRLLKGDPQCITQIRNYLRDRNHHILNQHLLSPYIYDYEYIHAHTVAQYSLSTLLMCMLGNFMYHKGLIRDINFLIDPLRCQQAYIALRFGPSSSDIKASAPITIPCPITSAIKPSSLPTTFKPSSWPDEALKGALLTYKCSKCSCVSEKLWGPFLLCLDCHVRKYCSECCDIAIVITADGLPKCNLHY